MQNELIHGNLPDLSISGLFKKYSSIRVFEYSSIVTTEPQKINMSLSISAFGYFQKLKPLILLYYTLVQESLNNFVELTTGPTV